MLDNLVISCKSKNSNSFVPIKKITLSVRFKHGFVLQMKVIKKPNPLGTESYKKKEKIQRIVILIAR